MKKLILLVALIGAIALNSHAQEGRFTYVEGDVFVRSHSGGEFVADLGTAVSAGDVVQTGGDGFAVIELTSRSSVKLRENTELVIDSLAGESAVTLNSGSVFARVQRVASGITGRAFEVRTPTVVAGVRGTEFFVAYGRTIDDVLDDIVRWVRPGDAVVLLSNGGFGGLHRRLLDALS